MHRWRLIATSAPLRRMLWLWLLLFWQGGFLFYGTVVVAIGTDEIGALQQGWITRRVTNCLNVAGAAALAAWAWDLAATPAPRGRFRWLVWLLLAVSLAVLAWLHLGMDRILDVDATLETQRDPFYSWHRWYLRVSTIQWLAAVALSWATLHAWRRHDAGPGD